MPHRVNDAFVAVNRLLKAGEEVFFVADRSYQSQDGTGVLFITARPSTAAVLQKAAADLGLSFAGVTARPAGALYKLTTPRIALWDQYGGSMPSGHLRWLLEQFEFGFEVIYPRYAGRGQPEGQVRRASSFRTAAFPKRIGKAEVSVASAGSHVPRTCPAEYRDRLGRVTIARTIPQLKRFAEDGGVVVAFGGSAVLGHHLGLPVSDHMVEVQADGSEKTLPATKYFIPGAILRVAVDNTQPSGVRPRQAGRCRLRQQPGVAARPGRHVARGDAGLVVRLEGAAAIRLGVGPALPRGRRRGRGGQSRQGQGVPDWTGDHVPGAAPRHVQDAVQRDLLRHGAARRRCDPGHDRPRTRTDKVFPMTPYGPKEMAESFRTVRKNTIQVAQDIPDDKYGFRAAEGVMSVGEMLAHLASSTHWAQQLHFVEQKTNVVMEDFGRYMAEGKALTDSLKSKADIVAALESRGRGFRREARRDERRPAGRTGRVPGADPTA